MAYKGDQYHKVRIEVLACAEKGHGKVCSRDGRGGGYQRAFGRVQSEGAKTLGRCCAWPGTAVDRTIVTCLEPSSGNSLSPFGRLVSLRCGVVNSGRGS